VQFDDVPSQEPQTESQGVQVAAPKEKYPSKQGHFGAKSFLNKVAGVLQLKQTVELKHSSHYPGQSIQFSGKIIKKIIF
jgi:hypothetical protein